jgi:hypothetical protein
MDFDDALFEYYVPLGRIGYSRSKLCNVFCAMQNKGMASNRKLTIFS